MESDTIAAPFEEVLVYAIQEKMGWDANRKAKGSTVERQGAGESPRCQKIDRPDARLIRAGAVLDIPVAWRIDVA